MKPATRTPPARDQQGFTLVELMIGVVLGLLTMLVVTQVTVQAEGRKRTVSMGSDAQVNGSLALYTLQRDLQMSGYGAVSSPDSLGCTVNGQYDTSGAAFSFTLAPVVITNGSSGAPDTVTVLHARTHDFSIPIKVTENHPQSGDAFVVNSSLGVAEGDQMIAVPKIQAPSTMCALFSVKSNTASAATTLGTNRIPHVSGTGTAKWNQSSVLPTGGYELGSYLLNMGQMVQRSYTVNSSQNLQAQERSTTDGSLESRELYPQIVNMQAMYGKDTTGDGVVDLYDNTTPTTNAGWLQVLTIRVAVVARSNQYEKDNVTTSAPLWDVGGSTTVSGATTSVCGSSVCIALKVSHVSDWQHYRYKVYETIVPLRNVLWNS